MGIYIGVSILLYLSVIFKSQTRTVLKVGKQRTETDLICAFSILLLLFLAVFRAKTVGADTKNYIYIFNQICGFQDRAALKEFAKQNYIETGYLYYNVVLSKITQHEQAITAVNSVLLFLPLCFLLNYSEEKRETVFLFYCLAVFQTALNLMPSSIASLIVLCSLESIVERKPIKTCAIIALAMLIHRSAFVFFALFFLNRIKLTKKGAVLIYAAGFAAYLSYFAILPIILRFVPSVYLYYFSKNAISNGGVFAFHSFIFLLILLLVDFNNDHRYFNVLMWGVSIELSFFWLGLRLVFFSRISLLFIPCLMLLIPICIRNMRRIRYTMIVRAGFYGMIFVQYVLRLFVNNIGTTIPYRFFWNP